MKFDYTFTKEDYQKFLKQSNNKYNYICLILFSLLYFGACLDLFTTNPLIIFITYLISVVILFSVLKIMTIVFIKFVIKRNDKVMELAYGTYKVELTKEKISEKLGDRHFELAYEDIARVSKKEKWLLVYPKNGKVMFLFLKDLFKKKDAYEKCVHIILENYEKAKSEKVEQKKEADKSKKKK